MRDLKKEPLKVGILGCGNFIVERILPMIRELDTIRIVSIQNRNLEKGREIASRFGIPNFVLNGNELLENHLIEAIIVASPSFIHEQDLQLCAKYDRPTLCEKPLAISSQSVEKILKTFQIRKIPLFVGFQQRFNPAVQKAKDLIEEGAIGKIQNIRTCYLTQSLPAQDNWRIKKGMGGGALQEIGIHLIDLIHFISGEEITKSRGFPISNGKGVDLITLAEGNLSKGGTFSVKCGFGLPYENGFEIIGTEGYLSSSGSLRTKEAGSTLYYFNKEGEKREFSIPWKNLYLEELKHFAKAVLEKDSPVIPAKISLPTQKAIDSIYQTMIL